MPVRAYTDRFSYLPGEQLKLFVDSASPEVDVALVRLTNADVGRDRSELDEVIPWGAAGRYRGTMQQTCVGSFAQAPVRPSTEPRSSFTLGCFIWSANLDATQRQVLMAARSEGQGEVLLVVDGTSVLFLDAVDRDPLAEATGCLAPRVWYLVAASVQPEHVDLSVIPCDPALGLAYTGRFEANCPSLAGRGTLTVAAREATVTRAAGSLAIGQGSDHFTGKLENPMVLNEAASHRELNKFARSRMTAAQAFGDAVLDSWSFTMAAGGPGMPNEVGGDDMVIVNNPTRGVTGRTWTGCELSFVSAPSEYQAIHFHSTDLADAGWLATLESRLPDILPSGVYGLRISTSKGSDTTPIVVRAANPSSAVLVLLPLFSYLAYANEALFAGELVAEDLTDQPVVVEQSDLAHVGDPSYGLSMYDTHQDGSGVAFSALRRPIVNMRPGYRMWLSDGGRGFSADMYLIEWLTKRGIAFDVACDLDVHRVGRELLDRYDVVMSGSHPEYTSAKMLEALRDYRAGGGNLMYLGGNGWYWVTGVQSCDPLIVEIRRGQAGVRCWESYPGEVTLTSTREPGGLWRHRGHAPQRLVGVGFCAQGWGRSEPYRRTEASRSPEVAWIFDGVDEEPIGNYGEVMGGAAGDELDRVDPLLGTPAGTIVLASSYGHSNFYQRSIEEIAMNLPGHGGGEHDPEVRADMVYVAWPEGGQCFSVGSIAWSGALLHNGGNNGVSRITQNVLTRFSKRGA
jgi:hypothetical protein